MTKTSLDVATRALRVIGVCALADNPTAEDAAFVREAAEGARQELVGKHSIPDTWTIETVPDDIFLAFADLCAAEVKGTYGFDGPRRSAAIGRIRAALLPDDRTDPRDTDADGIISDAEAEAGKQAAYF